MAKKKIKFVCIAVEKGIYQQCKELAKRLNADSALTFYVCLLEGALNVKDWSPSQMSDYLEKLCKEGQNND